jgi:hypothetical protein
MMISLTVVDFVIAPAFAEISPTDINGAGTKIDDSRIFFPNVPQRP